MQRIAGDLDSSRRHAIQERIAPAPDAAVLLIESVKFVGFVMSALQVRPTRGYGRR